MTVSSTDALLVRATCLRGDTSLAAWKQWRARVDFDDVDYVAAALLAGLAGRDDLLDGDAVAGRVRGLHRRAWAENSLRMRDARAAAAARNVPYAFVGSAAVLRFRRETDGCRPLDAIAVLDADRRLIESSLGDHADTATWRAARPVAGEALERELDPVDLLLELTTRPPSATAVVDAHLLLSLPAFSTSQFAERARAHYLVAACDEWLRAAAAVSGAEAVFSAPLPALGAQRPRPLATLRNRRHRTVFGRALASVAAHSAGTTFARGVTSSARNWVGNR